MINIKNYRISKVLVLLLIIFISTVGHVNAQKEEFKLIGSVKDTFGHVLSGATISCPETELSTVVSGQDGSFTIKGGLIENQLIIISLNG